jgi:hypothetical protein
VTRPSPNVTRMRAALAIALALLLGAIASLADENGVKKGREAVFVRVRTQIPEPVIHQDLSPVSAKGFGEDHCRSGCTLLPLEMKWNLETTFVTFSDGEQLYWVTALAVTLGYPVVDIYIHPRYRPGTCEYEAVLEHEREHLRADRILLEEYADKMRTLLAGVEWPTYASPAAFPSVAEAREQNKNRLATLVRPLKEELEAIRQRAADSVDAGEQWRGVTRSCSTR